MAISEGALSELPISGYPGIAFTQVKGQLKSTSSIHSTLAPAPTTAVHGKIKSTSSIHAPLYTLRRGRLTSTSSISGNFGPIRLAGTLQSTSSIQGDLEPHRTFVKGRLKSTSSFQGNLEPLFLGIHASQVVLETFGPDADGQINASQVVLETLAGGNADSTIRASQVVLETLAAVPPAEPIGAGAELRFPPAISYGAYGGSSGWSTTVVVTDNGTEYRVGRWHYSLGQWVVGHNLRQPSDWQALLALHRLAQGRNLPIRFQDWTDYTVAAGQGIVILNSAGQLQLAKIYQLTDEVSLTTYTDTRPIYKPQPGTLTFSNPSAGVTVDYTTGVISGSGVAAGTTTWTGQFDVSVRFDTDEAEFSVTKPGAGGFAGGWRSIRLVEVRPPTP